MLISDAPAILFDLTPCPRFDGSRAMFRTFRASATSAGGPDGFADESLVPFSASRINVVQFIGLVLSWQSDIVVSWRMLVRRFPFMQPRAATQCKSKDSFLPSESAIA